jgi:hypothetical protein
MFAALCLLAEHELQHKENERIGKARTTIRSASPIVIEIAY